MEQENSSPGDAQDPRAVVRRTLDELETAVLNSEARAVLVFPSHLAAGVDVMAEFMASLVDEAHTPVDPGSAFLEFLRVAHRDVPAEINRMTYVGMPAIRCKWVAVNVWEPQEDASGDPLIHVLYRFGESPGRSDNVASVHIRFADGADGTEILAYNVRELGDGSETE